MAGKLKIKADRWPWQTRNSFALLSDPVTEKKGTKYGWRGTPGMGRFGGGWNWCLGFRMSGYSERGWSIYIELLFGDVMISWRSALAVEEEERRAEKRRADEEWKAERERQEREWANLRPAPANYSEIRGAEHEARRNGEYVKRDEFDDDIPF